MWRLIRRTSSPSARAPPRARCPSKTTRTRQGSATGSHTEGALSLFFPPHFDGVFNDEGAPNSERGHPRRHPLRVALAEPAEKGPGVRQARHVNELLVESHVS